MAYPFVTVITRAGYYTEAIRGGLSGAIAGAGWTV